MHNTLADIIHFKFKDIKGLTTDKKKKDLKVSKVEHFVARATRCIETQLFVDAFATIVEYGMDPHLLIHRLLNDEDLERYKEENRCCNDSLRTLLL